MNEYESKLNRKRMIRRGFSLFSIDPSSPQRPGRKGRLRAQTMRRGSFPVLLCYVCRLRDRAEASEYSPKLSRALHRPVSASETCAELRTDGSEKAPRVSGCSLVHGLRLQYRTFFLLMTHIGETLYFGLRRLVISLHTTTWIIHFK